MTSAGLGPDVSMAQHHSHSSNASHTLVRMTFLSLSISGMVSKSLSSSTELSVSEPAGTPRSGEDNCRPPLELDSSGEAWGEGNRQGKG